MAVCLFQPTRLPPRFRLPGFFSASPRLFFLAFQSEWSERFFSLPDFWGFWFMTTKDRLSLSHARNLVYLQMVGGIAVAIFAADLFNVFEFRTEFFNQAIVINNFVAG